MLGVDRLDMIKGIPQKILAFEKFLEENPAWRDKVVLLQIAVPTRTDVPECMLLTLFSMKTCFKLGHCGSNVFHAIIFDSNLFNLVLGLVSSQLNCLRFSDNW